MLRANKIVSAIILICFLLNIAVSDLAFGLATPSALDNIAGIQHKDMGRIRLALEDQLVALVHSGLSVNIDTFQTMLKKQNFKEKTIFQPAYMQFFFHETKLTNTGLCVMVRLKDEYGLRTYYATFSLQKDGNGGFPIGVYTEEQYKGTAGFTKGAPQIKTKDAKAIERYVQHEKGIDEIIKYAFDNGLVIEPSPGVFDLERDLPELLNKLNVSISNPNGLIPIQNRKIYAIDRKGLPDEMQKKLGKITIVDDMGNEFTAACYSHASNNAIYVFMPDKESLSVVAGQWAQRAGELTRVMGSLIFKIYLVHEIGVICGLLPVKQNFMKDNISEHNMTKNELDRRFGEVNNKGKNPIDFQKLDLSIVNLDENLATRDYAAGKNRHTIPAPVSDAITNRAEVPQKEDSSEKEIAAMISLASETGQQIPTHPSERYSLLVTSEFFANAELEEHRAKYGDRFDLDRVSGGSLKQFVDNILAKAAGKETKTIALVPNDLPAEQLEKLTKVGIRFVRVNTTDLQKAKTDKGANREKFQVDTYAMMLLLRQIDNSITADSSIYRLLSFYLKTHFNFSDKIAIDDYIMAIAKNDIGKLILGILAYRPAQSYDVPDYNNVAASLISA